MTDDDIPEMPDSVDSERDDTTDDTDDDSRLQAAGDTLSGSVDGDRARAAAEAGGEALTDSTAAATRAAKAGSALAGAMLKTAKLIPYQARLFRRLALGGLKGYYKRSDADAIGIEKRPNGELDFVPVTYLASEVTDEGQRPGWQLHGRDRSYDAASMGDSVAYLKDTPIVPLHSDATVESTWMAPRIAEAVEMDQYWPVFTNSTLNPVFNIPQQASATGGPQENGALADGGNLQITADDFQGFEVADPGHYAGDSIVDLNSDDGHDGMRISFSKAQDILDERTTSERMDMQEQRGRIMSQLQGNEEKYAMKMLIVAGLIIVGTFAAIKGIPLLLGSGGGGGGINPLLALPLGL